MSRDEGGYAYLDDVAIADVAFRAWGPTVAAAFTQAALATVNAMVSRPHAIRPLVRHPVELTNSGLDLLLFDFLEELIYHKDAALQVLVPQQVRVATTRQPLELHAVLAGEVLDDRRHGALVDVKAVTLHRLRVAGDDRGWWAEAVLDT